MPLSLTLKLGSRNLRKCVASSCHPVAYTCLDIKLQQIRGFMAVFPFHLALHSAYKYYGLVLVLGNMNETRRG